MDAIIFETDEAIHTTIIDDDHPIALDLYLKGDDLPRVGDVYIGRVTSQKAGYAFIELGRPLPGLLKGKHLEGTFVCVQVRREEIIEPYQAKGAGLRLAEDKTPLREIGRIKLALPSWLQTLSSPDLQIQKIVTNSLSCFQRLQHAFPNLVGRLQLRSDLPFGPHLKQIWSSLEENVVSMPQGGYAIFEEGVALTAVDLNTSALGPLNAGINLSKPKDVQAYCDSALRYLMPEIKIRGYGGLMVIDFPRLKDAEMRQNIFNLCKKLAPHKADVFGFTKAGLFEVVLPRRSASLPSKIKRLRSKPWQS